MEKIGSRKKCRIVHLERTLLLCSATDNRARIYNDEPTGLPQVSTLSRMRMTRNLLSIPFITTQEERYCEVECTHQQNGLHVRAAVLVCPYLPPHRLLLLRSLPFSHSIVHLSLISPSLESVDRPYIIALHSFGAELSQVLLIVTNSSVIGAINLGSPL